MPNAAALQRGTEVGRAILEAHQKSNDGALPETVAVNLWGLDAIKTKVEPSTKRCCLPLASHGALQIVLLYWLSCLSHQGS